MDSNAQLHKFVECLREAIRTTVDDQGKMTKDLAISAKGTSKLTAGKDYLVTEDFMNAIQENLITLWNNAN